MRLWVSLAAAVLIADCAAAEEVDAAKLDQARSLIAEAALLEASVAGGRVTDVYAQALRENLRQDLEKLEREPVFAPIARQALDALARHDRAALVALRERLTTLERSHGRAG